MEKGDTRRPLLSEYVAHDQTNERHRLYSQNAPKIMLETISARANGIFALTYIVFVLALMFDIHTTVKGFNGRNAELSSESCKSQNIVVGTTEGNYGCTDILNSSQSSKTLTWIGHAKGFTNVISVAVKAKLSNTSTIFYNGSYIDDDSVISDITIKYDLYLYCCYSNSNCGNVSIPGQDDVNANGDWKSVLSLNNEKINIDKYVSLEDGDSSTMTLLPNTFQNQESLPTEGKVKSYLVYIVFDQEYSSYESWDQVTYTFRDISRPDVSNTDMALPVVILLTIIALGMYVYAIFGITHGKIRQALPEQKWCIVYLLAVILFQNPIYAVIVVFIDSPSPTAVYACYVLDALAQSMLITVWLLFADGLRRQTDYIWFYAPKVATGVCIFTCNLVVLTLQFPSMNPHDTRSPVEAVSNWSDGTKLVFIIFSISLITILWFWTFWWFYMLWYTGKTLQQLPYMTTRYLQLSFRFFSLQATLVTLYYFLQNILIVFYILQRSDWKHETLENITDNINTLFRQQSLSFGKVIFLTTYGLILAFFFLPASSAKVDNAMVSLQVSYVVSEDEMKSVRRKRKTAIRRLVALRQLVDAKLDIFCVDLALELHALSNEAYNDGGGLITLSGYGPLNLELCGYTLINQAYDSEHEAVCYIVRHKTINRVVVIFRGSASRQHWTDNLKFSQRPINLVEMPLKTLDLVDGLQIPMQNNTVTYNQGHGFNLFGGYDSDSDSDEDGCELVDTGYAEEEQGYNALRSRTESTTSYGDSDDHSRTLRHSFAEGASMVEGGLKRVATTVGGVVDATTGALRTAASHTPVLQLAVNTYVHSGFWEVYLTVREFIHSTLRQELSRSPAHLYFTGHSMGGALATLAAADVTLNTVPRINRYLRHKRRADRQTTESSVDEDISDSRAYGISASTPSRIRVGMYNFGSPRVGNWNFASAFNKIVPDGFRVVVDGDIVTGIPKGNYKHVGTEILIDGHGSGTIIIDPSFVESRLQKSNKTSVEAHSLLVCKRGLLGVKAATEYLHNNAMERSQNHDGCDDGYMYSALDIQLAMESSKAALFAVSSGEYKSTYSGERSK
mmetsp:Transcript_21523/g.31265  ORF Transcript_21523/g.31265 Transcript_21523/m.31265 type:complete len:1073 (+) Transcript_21523:100-3318(+)